MEVGHANIYEVTVTGTAVANHRTSLAAPTFSPADLELHNVLLGSRLTGTFTDPAGGPAPNVTIEPYFAFIDGGMLIPAVSLNSTVTAGAYDRTAGFTTQTIQAAGLQLGWLFSAPAPWVFRGRMMFSYHVTGTPRFKAAVPLPDGLIAPPPRTIQLAIRPPPPPVERPSFHFVVPV